MTDNENIVELKNISVSFDGETVLDKINLDIKDKEFVTFLGPSGCGKTTTLRLIAGFLEPDEGEIYFENKIINDVPAYKRQVNTIFQRYALFPHLNVYENIAFGLRVKKMKEKEIKEKVEEMLKLVNLTGLEKRSIDKLSGGQQQRVAIARALALNPDILCFDEPTSALDPELTGEVLRVIRDLKNENSTMIVVTHEMEFARNVSDKVIFMADGIIEEMGTPSEVFDNPKSKKTKNFLMKDFETVG